MTLMKASSPHAHQALDTVTVMRTVIFACIPGLLVLTIYFGFGSLLNVLLCASFCLAFEALSLRMRKRPVAFFLKDYSAVLTGVLLGLSLPPFSPWWLLLVGCFFSIVVAKQLYGGLGFNPFNPAMVGYVVLLISFPVEMSQWAAPGTSVTGVVPLSEGLAQTFLNQSLSVVDGYTAATPLDALKHNQGLTIDALYAEHPAFAKAGWAGFGWEWVNLAFLAGGAYLIYRKIFSWHAPVGMLAALFVLSLLFYDGGSSTSAGSPLFHLFSGAAMFGAFFIITDPVSSATSKKGRLIFGIGVGVLVFFIRVWGNYPDALAFAVLLMNFAAPFIDYYTLPRTYGHAKAKSARWKDD